MSLGNLIAGLATNTAYWTGVVSSVDPLEVRAGDGDVPVIHTGVGVWDVNVGDTVIVMNTSGSAFIMGRLDEADQPEPTPPPPPVKPGGSDKKTFRAIDIGSWDGSWRTDARGEAIQGDTGYGENRGYFFYGGGISSALSGVTVTSARIRMHRVRGGSIYAPPGQVVRMWRHQSAIRGPGEPTRDIGPQDIRIALNSGNPAWFPLDVSIAQNLTNGGGIAIAGGPYIRLAGLAEDPESGLIEISYTY